MAWCPQERHFVRRHHQRPHFHLNGMATQPAAVKVLVDQKYAPVPANAMVRAKSGIIQCYDLAYIDDGPVGDPDANLRLYDFLKEQIQRASHLMIGANIHDNPQRWRRPSPLYS